ncbi:ABC transporter substrate-binding protein [Eleftheria terrae]|uniref:ABC transporter substrate-binding protein n=1 Tax=Eleftheria terrae TaxID=1597781 RepID=UPI00263AEA3F|nr:ABC transporter substrate-binding protein [Eleftheria terrae]WKB53188.1 ABC transporter substrate-binding protein [Eleftheria terrae]
MKLPRLRLHPLLCGLAVVLAAGNLSAQTLRWASAGDPQTMDPYSQNENLTNNINHQIYEFLVERDRQLGFVPGLAVEWSQPNPLVWRFKLRPNVKFHDGRPFTADDVVFSVLRAREKTSQIAAYASALGEPKKIDDLTVEFQLTQFNPIFFDHLNTVFIMSRGWSEEHKAQRPLDFTNKEESYTSFNANGTGPYMLALREPDVKTVLKRNPNYWGRIEGNVQEMIYTPIKSDATRVAALLSGEVDFVLDPPPRDLERLRQARGVRVVEGPENRVIFIGMDQARDQLLYSSLKGKNPFKDLRVRRALYHAIDIDTIRTKLMNGQSAPTGALVPSPKASFGDPDIERRLPYDPALAKKLMQEAGYADGFDVAMDCPNNRYVNDERICQTLASMWARIGVKVRVNALPKTTFFPKVEKLDTSLYLFGWGGSITDAETTFTPIYRNRADKGVGEYNRGNYTDDTLDALVAASSKESDPDKRRALIKQVFLRHNDQVRHIPLHRQYIPWAMRSGVQVVHKPDNWLELRWVTLK